MRARRAYRAALLGTAGLTLVLAVLAYGLDAFGGLENSSVDARFQVRGDHESPEEIVFVKIDDETFNELRSEFPLPRITHANVIDNLAADGAETIAYDVQFTEPGPDPKQDNALILATRRAGNVVLATTEVDAEGRTRIFGGGAGLKFARGTPSESRVLNDGDGAVRRMEFEIDGLESFAMASAESYLGRELEPPEGDTAWIDYVGSPGAIDSVSFSDVESGDFDPGTFDGKIAVVGAFAPSLQDRHETSTTTDGETMPGPEIHANAMATAIDGFPLSGAPGWLNVLLIALFAVMAPLISLRTTAIRAVLITLGAAALFLIAAQLAFNAGEIVAVVYPLLAAGASSGVSLLLFALMTAFERERARDAFGRFVPEAVVGKVLDQADGMRLGGERTVGTLLFSDLRGFTSFAETREPDEVIEILNRYLAGMSDAILDSGGTLVSYMGDGIMAMFGAPVEQEDHADRAVRASREMLRRLDVFNDWLVEEGISDGFKMGIGLNTGNVMVGNVGSERRLEYTAIGDTTNTAARLEGMTKGTPWQLYIADSTRKAMLEKPKRREIEQVGEFEVRGRKAKIKLWTLPDTRYVSSAERAAESEGSGDEETGSG
jgi:adenylate cyclase